VPDPGRPFVVFAAASTTDVIGEAARRFQENTGVNVVLSFDSSSNLARQIKAGAPVDVFLSADEAWMNDLEAAGAVRTESRIDLLSNELVLITPTDKPLELRPTTDFDFVVRLPQVKRIAVGDPAHVPVGRCARQTLESLRWWATLQPLLIQTQDARAALRLVELGEADAGIVYVTDAQSSKKVGVAAIFPSHLHEPIRYPIAACKNSPTATQFIEYLRSVEMSRIFEQAGFRTLNNPRQENR
jgi:molybdate transport system substrate-binding protein